jgi:hypothetical protein
MSIKFEKIKPGMTLYDVAKSTGYAQRIYKWEWWTVKVIEVDAEKRRVLASWNANPAKWISEKNVTKYRAQLPKNR